MIVLKTMGGDGASFCREDIRVVTVDPGGAILRRTGSSHVSIGFSELEERMGGIEGGDLVIVAGNSGRLNSSFAISLIQRVCVAGRHPVLYFSPGCEASVVFFELLVNCGQLNGGWKRGYRHDELARFNETRKQLENTDLLVHDEPELPLSAIAPIVDGAIDVHGVRMVVVNHIDLVCAEGLSLFKSSQMEEIARSLKLLARTRNIVVALMVQVGIMCGSVRRFRALERYAPIDRYADAILFLQDLGHTSFCEVEASIVRSRLGANQGVRLGYIRHQYRLEDLAVSPDIG